MERKIGEIFEFGGGWYQCLKGISCKECDFSSNSITCDIHGAITCTGKGRSDDTSVVFKKLEKVGEPYFNGQYGEVLQEYKYYIPPITPDLRIHIIKLGIVGIEIKQTKEDMEENRTINQQFAECEQTINDVVRKCYTENKSTQIKDMEEYKIRDAKEDIPEFDKVVDECLFGKQELKLKPFDLEAAKAGKPVCTRDGRKARIICFDKQEGLPIVALVETKKNGRISEEIALSYINGRAISVDIDSKDDLMMLSEKKQGWVNVYYDRIDGITFSKHPYPSKEEAIKNVGTMSNRVDTIKICWEE